jgi:Cdc6-like AAA superfamily ATPase
MITTEQKKEIAAALKNYVGEFHSQKKAAETLKDCSEATVIAIVKGNYDNVSESMWLNLSKQLGIGKRELRMVETRDFQTLILYYSIAKEEGASFALVGPAGSGKSFAGRWFAKANRGKNVYYLECAEYWNKKQFLGNLLKAIGKENTGMNAAEMMETIVSELHHQHQPLIILDEVDKLADPVLKFFITLYNELNTLCGFVWTSTNAIEKRITKGVNTNKIGYKELLSRIGSAFIQLPGANAKEITEMCEANGINDRTEIAFIINDCKGDLRRVERSVLKNKLREEAKRKTSKAAA